MKSKHFDDVKNLVYRKIGMEAILEDLVEIAADTNGRPLEDWEKQLVVDLRETIINYKKRTE
jgi:hypothetical protein